RTALLLVAFLTMPLPATAVGIAESAIRTFSVQVRADTTVTAPTTPPDPRLELPEVQRIDDPLARSARPARQPRRDPFVAFGRRLRLPGWGQASLGDHDGAFAYGGAFAVAIVLAFGVLELPFLDDAEFSRSIGYGLWGT